MNARTISANGPAEPPPEDCAVVGGGAAGAGAAPTVILNELLTVAPDGSVAVTVTANDWLASVAVGVPVIMPVAASMPIPPGRPVAE